MTAVRSPTASTWPAMMLAMLCALLFAVLLALLIFAAPAHAHHSGAMFDRQKATTLTGTVRQFQWTNPHCYVQLLVLTDKGEMQEWSLEMGAPLHIYASGWRPGTLKVGDKITVTIFPLRNGAKGGEIQTATTADGKKLAGTL
jgi:hypothetical protein